LAKNLKENSSKKAALDYHEFPQPGKLEIRATKPLANQRDLSRAYSPGVAEACLEIKEDENTASKYTSKGNLVAVISNGTAVLGLGNIGPGASKPVMEGKAVLFKKFANIDCFDIEVDEDNPQRLAEIVASLEPTFGAINLEDIKAPDCFEVERLCKEKMKIPVFHDDQHGTAIVVGAAAVNAIELSNRKIENTKIVAVGAGASGIACLEMLVKLGAKRENIWLSDSKGLITKNRSEINEEKKRFSQDSNLSKLDDVIKDCDMFLGLSGPGVLTSKMVLKMNKQPIIFALANPDPEINPADALKVAPDALIATGRSDYPNQVNNVLCFPFIFRGALDVGATQINDEMKLACIHAIANLARQTSTAETVEAYQGEILKFGKEYLIPKPFDPRLLPNVAVAVAEAAMKSGVASRPLKDVEAYKQKLEGSVYKSTILMKPVFEAAKTSSRKIVFAEGEDERTLRTALALLEETNDKPILIGRPEVVENRIERYGLPLVHGKDFELVNPQNDPRFREYWEAYLGIMERKGVTPALAREIMRTNTTAIGAIMVKRGEADSLICGTFGQYLWHLKYIEEILSGDGLKPVGALSMMILESDVLFVADCNIHPNPSAEEIAEIVIGAARHTKRFGVTPKIALCSHSQFGSLDTDSGRRMRGALDILDSKKLDFSYEGEMHSDSALDEDLRKRIFRGSRFAGAANVLVFSNIDAASGVRNILKMRSNGIEVGPILMGMGNKAHIVSPSITTRGLLNISALAGTPVQIYG
jgi:malate dehydrogenase (oxaloacetate-decarboxylating)(NADP+)